MCSEHFVAQFTESHALYCNDTNHQISTYVHNITNDRKPFYDVCALQEDYGVAKPDAETKKLMTALKSSDGLKTENTKTLSKMVMLFQYKKLYKGPLPISSFFLFLDVYLTTNQTKKLVFIDVTKAI